MTADINKLRPIPLAAFGTLAGLQIIAVSLWLLFGSVAHYGYRNYFVLMFLAYSGAALVTAIVPRLRWFFFAAMIVCLPRVPGIVFQAPAHNVLFPWLAGMGLGLFLRLLFEWIRSGIVRREQSSAHARNDLPAAARESIVNWNDASGVLALLGIFLLASVARAFFESYSPYVLFGLPVMDLEIAPGVSANYGFYLSLFLIIHLAGPLLFYFSDRAFTVGAGVTGDIADRIDVAGATTRSRQLLFGLAFGAAAHLSALWIESLGFLQLAGGAGDYWREAGRLPGLLTDSGASTLMTPFLIATACLACHQLYVKFYAPTFSVPTVRDRTIARTLLWPTTFAGLAAVAIGFPLSYWHGRAFFLNAGGVVLLATLILVVLMRRRTRRPNAKRVARRTVVLVLVILGVAFVMAAAAGVWIFLNSDVPALVALRGSFERMAPLLAEGQWYTALLNLDQQRAFYLLYGGRLLLESPWIGHGLNSFQVELTRFAATTPGMLIDNPANLPLGLLTDAGVLGAGIFVVTFAWALRRFAWYCKYGDSVGMWLAGLPLAFLPAMCMGYHLVVSEFSAVLLIPFLLRCDANTSAGGEADGASRTELKFATGGAQSSQRTRKISALLLNGIAGLFVFCWIAGSTLYFASATGGPERWRFSKTGRNQPALNSRE